MGAVMISGLVILSLAGDYIYFGAMRETIPVTSLLFVAPLAAVVSGAAGGLFPA